MKLEKEYIIEYYNKFYEANDFRYYSESISNKLLKTICRISKLGPDAKILDLGCGTGIYTDIFRRLGYDSIGIDISQTAITKAAAKYPLSRYEVADALNLKYELHSFDMIFLFGCSIVNTDDLLEIDRVLKYLLQFVKKSGSIVFIGGSNLLGGITKSSEWYNHTWSELKKISSTDSFIIHGPYLSHLRIVNYLGKFGISRLITLFLRLRFFKFQRKVFFFIKHKASL